MRSNFTLPSVGEQGIVAADAYVLSWMNVSSSLTVQNVASQYELTVCTFCAETFGFRESRPFFVEPTPFYEQKNCMLSLSIVVHLRKFYLDCALIILCQQVQMKQQRLEKGLSLLGLLCREHHLY